MSIREAQVRFTPNRSSCSYCGHSHLAAVVRNLAFACLWTTHCPACGREEEHVTIPGWFLQGLPSNHSRPNFH